MKIDRISELLMNGQRVTKGEEAPRLLKQDFKRILEETVGEQSRTNRQGLVTGLEMLCVPVQPVSRAAGEEAANMAEHLDGILDVLEDYARVLQNPAAGVRDIAPYVHRIEREQGHLCEAMGCLPEGDALRGIIEDVLITLSTEMARFQRGDYA